MKENKVKKVLTAIEDIDRIKLVLKLYKANQLTEDEALEMIRSDEQFHRVPPQQFPITTYPITYPISTPSTGTPWVTYTTASSHLDTTNGGTN